MKKTRKFQPRQYMLTNNYEVFHYSDVFAEDVPVHHHDFYEIYYCITDVEYIIEGKLFRLEQGDILTVNTNELHQPLYSHDGKCYERLVIWINKDYASRLSTETTDLNLIFCQKEYRNQNLFRLPVDIQQVIKLSVLKLIELENTTGYDRLLAGNIYIAEILLSLNNSMLKTLPVFADSVRQTTLINNVLDFINEHIAEDITLDDISNQFFISKFNLSRRFKQHTGTSIHKYIVKKRLIHAKEFILQGLSLDDVIVECGFGDYCNFLKAFKNEYSITPRQFSNHYKKMNNIEPIKG